MQLKTSNVSVLYFPRLLVRVSHTRTAFCSDCALYRIPGTGYVKVQAGPVMNVGATQLTGPRGPS